MMDTNKREQIAVEEKILHRLHDQYIELIEDVGIMPEEILISLLAKAYIEIKDLKCRLRKYE